MKILAPMRSVRQLTDLSKMCQAIIRPDFVVAELGCFYGESTVEFSKHARQVYAIDPWEEGYIGGPDYSPGWRKDVPETMAEVELTFDAVTRGIRNIKKIRSRHEDAVSTFPNTSLDLVYCDAIHSEEATLAAIRLWTPKVKTGGYMAGHDYTIAFPGVVRAVQTSLRNQRLLLWGDGNWAYRIT